MRTPLSASDESGSHLSANDERNSRLVNDESRRRPLSEWRERLSLLSLSLLSEG